MTNRSKSAKKPRLRFLDLAFESRDDEKRGSLDNGRRPHGGIRGSKKHPPTPFAQDKSRDYHRKLREDIDRLFEDEFLEVHGTPSWTVEASREITHSGESPLFLHKFMSPTRAENQCIRHTRSAVTNPNKCQPPLSRDGVTFYRPNRTHQYLTATELKDQSQGEVNLKYGRPTRTTLLRARQRTNSAPVNSYELRRENMKREEELRNSSVYTNPKEFLQEVHGQDGETFHSFITGARYNRAHCIDAKSLTLYGVYMPRDNPTACFVTGPNKLKDVTETPGGPPDSPRSDVDEASSPMAPRRPTTAPGYGRRPTPMTATHPRQAWGGEGESLGERNGDGRVYEELIFWPSGLSVKGRSLGVNLKRTNSMPRLDAKLPSVHGISMERKSRDPVEETSLINQPPPSPLATSTREEVAVTNEKVINESSGSAKPEEPPKKEPVPKKPKPILVDRSVNVPSVSGDSINWNEEFAMKVTGSSVPHHRPASESGSGKAVTFQKETKSKEGKEEQEMEPEKDTGEQDDQHEEITMATKEPECDAPSGTDGVSVEVRADSSVPASDQFPPTPQVSEVTVESMSIGSQGTDQEQEQEQEQEQNKEDQMKENSADTVLTSNEDNEKIAENIVNKGTSPISNIDIDGTDACAFFITEKEGNDGQQEATVLLNNDQDITHDEHSDHMVIPKVTIEEASISGDSELNDDQLVETTDTTHGNRTTAGNSKDGADNPLNKRPRADNSEDVADNPLNNGADNSEDVADNPQNKRADNSEDVADNPLYKRADNSEDVADNPLYKRADNSEDVTDNPLKKGADDSNETM